MRRPIPLLAPQSGFTLAEVLVVSAVGLIIALAVIASLANIHKEIAKAKRVDVRNQMVNSLVESLREDIERYQATFVMDESEIERRLAEDQLPLAWSTDRLANVPECPDCPGRMGFVIQPVPNLRGTYLVTVRIVNPQMFPGHRDYEFTVSGK